MKLSSTFASAAGVLVTLALASNARADEPAPPSISLAPTVSIATDAGLPPVVAYANTSHRALVVWSTMVTSGASDPPIHGAILDDEGVVVVPPFAIAPTGRMPAVASDGKGFVVAHGDASEPGITVRTVDAKGSVSSPTVVAASDEGTGNARPIIAWDGATYRFLWYSSGPVWMTSFLPPASPGKILSTKSGGLLACVDDTCLIAGGGLSRWKRGASPEPPVPYDYQNVVALAVRGQAFDLVRIDRSKNGACEDTTLCVDTAAIASIGATGPLGVDWSTAQKVHLPASLRFAAGSTGKTTVLVGEPLDASAALVVTVPGATPEPLLPYVAGKTYGKVTVTTAAPGRALVVAAGGIATGNLDPPFHLVARVVTVDKDLNDIPPNADPSGRPKDEDPTSAATPDGGTTTGSSSGCSVGGASTSSPAAGLAVLAFVLGRRRRGLPRS